MRFYTEITIHTDAPTVWALLTDAAGFPTWNPTVAAVEGTIALGEKVTVRTTANPKQAFPVKVAVLEAPHRMVWRGGMPLGLFTGERTFLVEPKGEGIVLFSMEETFTGLMAPLITRSIPNLQPDFDRYAEALKTAADN